MILWSTVLCAWATAVVAQSTTDAKLIGWYLLPDFTQKFTAKSGWTTSGTVAGDCAPSSSCLLHTACTSNTLFFDGGGLYACTSQNECATWTIYENVQFGGPSATNWECRPPGTTSKATFYKSLPTTPASEITVYATVTATVVMGSSNAALPTPSTSLPSATSPTLAPSATPATTPSSNTLVANDGPESKAWIAGAVVGPIVGIGLCVTAYWLWMRYRKHHNRHLGPRQQPHWRDQIPATQQVEPWFEGSGKPLRSPVMLHADTSRRTPELPGSF